MLERITIENNEEYLRQRSKEVDFEKDDWLETIEKLDYFCTHDDNIMAIASVQLGIPLRLIYLKKTNIEKLEEDYNESRILINPVVLKEEGLTTYWEACASCLTNTGLVERPYRVEVEYYDINKVKHHEVFEGFESTVLCHEVDHLDGILHLDIALKVVQKNREERKKLRKKEPYKIIEKRGDFHSLKTKGKTNESKKQL